MRQPIAAAMRGEARRGVSSPHWVLVTIVTAGLLLAGCTTDRPSGDGGYVSGTGLVTIIDEADRPEAPDISGEDLDGRPVALDDHAGQVVVLNVWGSWCPPCRAEAPVLAELSAELSGDVAFLGIVIRDQVDAARAFEDKYGIDYPSIFDPGGKQLLGFRSYPAAAVPTTFVIDERGRIGARILDEVKTTTLLGVIEDVRLAPPGEEP